jgi:hypothetical protein
MILKLQIGFSKPGIEVLKLQIEVLKLQIEVLKLRIEHLKLPIEVLKLPIEVLKLAIDDLKSRIDDLKFGIAVLKLQVYDSEPSVIEINRWVTLSCGNRARIGAGFRSLPVSTPARQAAVVVPLRQTFRAAG